MKDIVEEEEQQTATITSTTIAADIKPSDSDLNQRLIQVLEEEKDLKQNLQINSKTPVIKEGFFKEIFDNKRMNLQCAELSASSDENMGTASEKVEESEVDEEAFIKIQR